MERSAWPKNLSSSGKQAIKELLDGQNPTKKIRDLFDAHSQTGIDAAQPLIAEDLVVNVLGSFSNTLSLSSSAAESYEFLQVPSNACIRSEVSKGSESIHPQVPRTLDTWTRHDQHLIDIGVPKGKYGLEQNLIDKIDNHGHGRRTYDQKLVLNSSSRKVTTSLIDDGYPWRQCGQMEILESKYPRDYYSCVHELDQGCQATKQVQMIDDDRSLYMTTYEGPHTCLVLGRYPRIPLAHPGLTNPPQAPGTPPFPLSFNTSLIAEQEDGSNSIFINFQSASSVGDIEPWPSDQGM